jgi:hypothetical protein
MGFMWAFAIVTSTVGLGTGDDLVWPWFKAMQFVVEPSAAWIRVI